MTTNDYHKYISELSKLVAAGKKFQLGGFPDVTRPQVPKDAPTVLIFSPHPDDECVIGAFALRLMRESQMNVINVAVTQGNKAERKAERLQELQNACKFLGFGLVQAGPTGLDRIKPQTRAEDPAHWSQCVNAIAKILDEHKPHAIFFPHEHDWNTTHTGTHFLLIDALNKMSPDFECFIVETEYWAPMADPNLMVEINATDLADMLSALSFHVGEVKRNPYHLSVPAWMIDNVRRAEIVGGQGSAAPDFMFATIYRLSKWSHGKLERAFSGGKFLSCNENAASILK
jgi:N-acetylglucosamine malate deacetylase 1